MENEVLERIANALLRLGYQEQQILNSFSNRLQLGTVHVKLATQLRAASNNPAESKRYIDQIRSLLQGFRVVSSYVARESELVKQELRELTITESAFREDIAESQQTLAGIHGNSALKKLYGAIENATQGLKQNLAEAAIDKRIEYALNEFLPIVVAQQKSLADEDVILSRALAEQNPVERARLAASIAGFASGLQLLLIEEKHKFVEPLNLLMRQKQDVRSVIDKIKLGIADKTKTFITLDDVKEDLRKFTKPDEVAEYAMLLQKQVRNVDPQALKLLSMVGAKAFERVKTASAALDAVTLLYNRAYFDTELQRRINATNNGGKPFALIMFDIDNFKGVNDNQSHATGDAALRTVATILRSHTKINDAVCRFGGEELVVLVDSDSNDKDKSIQHALDAAERLRDLIETTTKQLIAARRLFGTMPITDRKAITASVGVALYTATMDDVKHSALHLIERADKALYKSKKLLGKNVVSLAE